MFDESRTHDVLGFFLLAVLWGMSFPAVKAGLSVLPPFLFAAFRFDLTGLLVLGFAVARADRWRPRGRDWAGILAGAATFVAAHHALLFLGQARVTSAVAAVVVAASPILVAVLARVLLPAERLGAVGFLGLFVGLAGVGVVADLSFASLAVDAGVALVFAAALAWALGSLLVQRARTDLPVSAMQGWMMVCGAPLLHLGSVAVGEPQALPTDPLALAALAYLAPVAGGGGYLLYFALLDRLGSVEINLVGYAVPAFAALGGWVLLGETLAPRTVAGFGGVLLGFALVKRRALRETLTRTRGRPD